MPTYAYPPIVLSPSGDAHIAASRDDAEAIGGFDTVAWAGSVSLAFQTESQEEGGGIPITSSPFVTKYELAFSSMPTNLPIYTGPEPRYNQTWGLPEAGRYSVNFVQGTRGTSKSTDLAAIGTGIYPLSGITNPDRFFTGALIWRLPLEHPVFTGWDAWCFATTSHTHRFDVPPGGAEFGLRAAVLPQYSHVDPVNLDWNACYVVVRKMNPDNPPLVNEVVVSTSYSQNTTYNNKMIVGKETLFMVSIPAWDSNQPFVLGGSDAAPRITSIDSAELYYFLNNDTGQPETVIPLTKTSDYGVEAMFSYTPPEETYVTYYLRVYIVVAGKRVPVSTGAMFETYSLEYGPIAMSPPSVSGTLIAGQTLTASPGVWQTASGTTPTFTYTWYGLSTPPTPSTSSTYTLAPADAGREFSVEIKATDGDDEAYEYVYGKVQASDVPYGEISFYDVPKSGTMLYVNTARVRTTTTPTYTYEWYVDGNVASTASSLSVPVGSSHIRVSVSATVPGGTSWFEAEAYVQRAAEWISAAGALTLSGVPQVGQTLTIGASTLSFATDYDPAKTIYEFYNGRVLLQRGPSTTYVVTADDVGGYIWAKLLVYDSTSEGETASIALGPVVA